MARATTELFDGTLSRRLLIHSVRVAARCAAEDRERNPAFVRALELMAEAVESAGISSRSDGDYWLVKIPDVERKAARR